MAGPCLVTRCWGLLRLQSRLLVLYRRKIARLVSVLGRESISFAPLDRRWTVYTISSGIALGSAYGKCGVMRDVSEYKFDSIAYLSVVALNKYHSIYRTRISATHSPHIDRPRPIVNYDVAYNPAHHQAWTPTHFFLHTSG